MPKYLLRSLLLLFGGFVAAQIVELALTSSKGQQLARQAGVGELTTYRGVELAQKYARAIVNVLVGAGIAVTEYLDSRSPEHRSLGWPERIQVSAQVLLAVSSIAKTASEFIEERRRLLPWVAT
jgi:hypothetical protein